MIGIYKITNPKGAIYIGQSVNIKDRERKYINGNCSNQIKLYRSIKKYGWEAHRFEVLELCKKNSLNKLEIFYSEKYNSIDKEKGLNVRHCGGSRASLNESTKIKIAAFNVGRVVSEETRNKIREKLIGNIPWNKGRKGQRAWNKGIPAEESTKNKLRIFYKGKIGKEANASKAIIQYDLSGNTIRAWDNARQINRELNYSFSCINRCCRNERKSSYGFIWKYK